MSRVRGAYLEFLGEPERDEDGERGEERREEHAHVPDVDRHVQEVHRVVQQR